MRARPDARSFRAGEKHGRRQDQAGRRGPQLIALTEKYEVADWSKKFNVTPAKLKYAVKKVGHSARKVEDYIKLQQQRAADKTRIALGEAYEVRYWSKTSAGVHRARRARAMIAMSRLRQTDWLIAEARLPID